MSVYIVQNPHTKRGNNLIPKYDFKPAEEYGELIHLLSPSAKPFASTSVVHELQAKLKNYTSDDYLLLVGNPCLIGFATAIASDANDGFVNLLQWNGRQGKYVVIEADLRAED